MVNPEAGSEDMSFVLEEVPGAYLNVSACAHADLHDAQDNHSPRAAFDDAVVPPSRRPSRGRLRPLAANQARAPASELSYGSCGVVAVGEVRTSVEVPGLRRSERWATRFEE